MSRRRCKHVLQSSLQDEVKPPAAHQSIVRAVGSRGGNHVEVEFPDGRRTLAMLPARFNKKLWVRRGGYLIIEEGVAEGAGAVSALIVSVLYVDGVRALRKLPGVWPAEFHAADAAGSERAGASGATNVSPAAVLASSRGVQEAVGGEERRDSGAGAAVPGADDRDRSSGSDSDGLPPLQANSNRRTLEWVVSDSDSEASGEDKRLDRAMNRRGAAGMHGLSA